MATEYVVLEQVAAGDWRELSSVTATHDKQAIKAVSADLESERRAGTFVAVPARSWQPRKRSIETREIDRWS
jgi:hypothetical protein